MRPNLPPSVSPLPPSLGLTLIELLVVMTILSLLIGTAIPVLSPSSDERRLREASRGVNAFIAGAQARAAQSGRPFGVMLKKLSQETSDPDDNAVCLEMLYVEEPIPFAGFEETSRCRLRQLQLSQPQFNEAARRGITEPIYNLEFLRRATGTDGQFPLPGWTNDLVPPGTIRPGDVIRVNGVALQLIEPFEAGDTPLDESRLYYETVRNGEIVPAQFSAVPIDGNVLYFVPVVDGEGTRLDQVPRELIVNSPNIELWTDPSPFRIERLPTLTSAPPYQLPEGTAIDLRASGTNELVFHRVDRPDESDAENLSLGVDLTGNPLPVIIMFSPEGAITRLYMYGDDPNGVADNNNEEDRLLVTPVTSSVFLLVGLRENIPATLETDFATFSGSDRELNEEKAKINWLNGEARWVRIGGQTGSVTTASNSFVNPIPIANDNSFDTLSARRDREIFLARELATQGVAEGGR
ncbi:MAG: type II secretion system protein [Planctomycetota bacterium]